MQSSVTGRKTNENTLTARLTRCPLPSRCRLCLADRVRTSAPEAAIAAELEGFYLRQHGEEKGRQIACALLEDLMESGPLKAAPSLSFLGLVVMDELCARHIKAPVLH